MKSQQEIKSELKNKEILLKPRSDGSDADVDSVEDEYAVGTS